MVEPPSGADSANFEVFPHDVTSELRLMDEKLTIDFQIKSDPSQEKSRFIHFHRNSPKIEVAWISPPGVEGSSI